MPRYCGVWSPGGPVLAITHDLSNEVMERLHVMAHEILAVAGVPEPDDAAISCLILVVLNSAQRARRTRSQFTVHGGFGETH